jgi:amino acid transporter
MSLWQFLIGRPIRSREAAHEEIGSTEGLAALSLDALSSVAYGPEAIALVLVTAGAAALHYLLPISLAIVGLLAILVLSYSQVIEAYPRGGGAYAVSRENLGTQVSQVAAAALVVDYILTVAISISAGVEALSSAFPVLRPATLPLCLVILAAITLMNLRGVGDSARAFLLPTMVFIVGLLALLAWGFVHPVLPVAHPALPPARSVPLFFLLTAFAAGCTALTGVEAIANGVPLFREPRMLRAKRTEWLLGGILGLMLLGLAILTIRFGVLPGGQQTMLSRVMTAAVGRSWAYYVVSLAITAVLGLAANTSFGGLPLLASILARDQYLPHVFAMRGDRLVFSPGIWVLSCAAAVLLIASDGNTQALIPLFAIGVFTGFTLSQAGMVVHWWHRRVPNWKLRIGLNGLGALATGVATLLFVGTKFLEGAWVVVLAIPLLVWMFRRVHHYYGQVDEILEPGQRPGPVVAKARPLVVVPITPTLTALTRRALDHALSLSDEVIAVAVLFDPETSSDPTPESLHASWEAWDPPVRLVTLHSQYHSVVRPLIRFIATLDHRTDQRVLVLIPEVVPSRPADELLHNRVGWMVASALRRRTDVLIGMVPMHLREEHPAP